MGGRFSVDALVLGPRDILTEPPGGEMKRHVDFHASIRLRRLALGHPKSGVMADLQLALELTGTIGHAARGAAESGSGASGLNRCKVGPAQTRLMQRRGRFGLRATH